MKQFQLGNPGPLRDKLVKSVLDGKKIATSSLLSDWQEENEQLPHIGERQSLADSHNNSVAVIEITDVIQYRLADIDDTVAQDEGEGFSNVTEWRMAHEEFWSPKVINDDTIVVVERFKLVS